MSHYVRIASASTNLKIFCQQADLAVILRGNLRSQFKGNNDSRRKRGQTPKLTSKFSLGKHQTFLIGSEQIFKLLASKAEAQS